MIAMKKRHKIHVAMARKKKRKLHATTVRRCP
jgi:hypothetical protein